MNDSRPAPEILPPQVEQYEDMPPRPRRRPGWAYAPATYGLVAVNCLVFAAMVLTGSPLLNPGTADLLHWGANYGVLVLHGEWWRIVSAMFVHVGLVHLATNMWCLWNLGLLGEPLLGPVGIVAAYILSGAAGNLLSVAVHPQIPGAGASGAVFGLAGVLIVILKSPRLPASPAEIRGLRRSVIYFALLNFAIGAATWLSRSAIQIDNMAHLGGFLGGLLFGLPLVPRIGSPPGLFRLRRRVAIAMLAGLLTLFAYFLSRFLG